MRKGLFALGALSAAFLLSATAGASSRPVRVGVILKGLDNPFFVAMYEGARAESARRHVVATFRAATNLNDVAGQAKRARSLRRGRHDCYVVNPITPTNLLASFRGLKRPIVNVDSPLDSAAARRSSLRVITFIGTNDEAVGGLAAEEMKSRLHGRGEVALLDGFASSVNSQRRLRGFTRGVKGTHIRIVARVIAGYDRARAQLAARRIVREHPKIAGFFAANDVMALGVADALQAAGKRRAVYVIGVDAIPPALDAVRTGVLTATVAQYPYVMGRMAVEACVAAARGANLPTNVKAPIALVTKANVNQVNTAFPMPTHPYSDPFARLLRGSD